MYDSMKVPNRKNLEYYSNRMMFSLKHSMYSVHTLIIFKEISLLNFLI